MQRPMLIDRARDLFLDDTTMTPERGVFVLTAEYPEFTRDQCQEAVSLFLQVRAIIKAKAAN